MRKGEVRANDSAGRPDRARGPAVGDIVPVRITGQATNSLFGEFVGMREATAA